MSIEKIIQESINKNPLAMKEALEEELRNRLALALEAKMKEDEDMYESFDLSDLTLEELEDFMMSEDFDQLDEISKKKVADYMDKSHDEYKRLQQKGGAAGGTSVMNAKQKRRYATGSSASDNAYMKATGRARVNATESFDLSDLTLEELEDFMMSEDFDQLDEISKGTLRSYVKKADKAADKSFSSALKQQTRASKGAPGAAEKQAKHSRDFDNRATGLDRANARLSKMKEDLELDEMSKKLTGGQRSAKMGAASDPSERIIPKRGTKAYAAWAAKNAERRKAALAKQKNEDFDLDEGVNHWDWKAHHDQMHQKRISSGDMESADLHSDAKDAHSKAINTGSKADSKKALELSRKARNDDREFDQVAKRSRVGAMGKVG